MKLRLSNWFKSSQFAKSIATLVSGSFIAQIITVICSVLLARIYSPDQMGIYTLFLTAESLFGSVICLRYDVSIVSEREEIKVYSLIKLCVIVTLILSFIISLVYGYAYIYSDPNICQYSYLIILLFIMLASRGIINILESYNNRFKEYKLMTSAYVMRTSVQNIGAILLGMIHLGLPGLIFAHTFGSLSGVKRQSKSLKKNIHKIVSTHRSQLFTVAKDNRNQPFFSTPAIFANRYSYSSISLFINQLFGTTVLGYYSISYKALGLPLTVLSNNVSKVFFKDATKEFEHTGRFARTFIKTSIILLFVSIPLGFLLYWLLPSIIQILLGYKWLIAADYARILLPMFCIRLIVNTIAYGFQIVNKQFYELVFQITLVLCSITALLYTRVNDLEVENFLNIINVLFSIVYIIYYLVVGKYALSGLNHEQTSNQR